MKKMLPLSKGTVATVFLDEASLIIKSLVAPKLKEASIGMDNLLVGHLIEAMDPTPSLSSLSL